MFSQIYFSFFLKVRGTIFNELDDEKLHGIIDFTDFEEQFKIGHGGHITSNGDMSEVDSLHAFGSKRFKKPELTSLLEHTRLRNIGKQLIYWWSNYYLTPSGDFTLKED